MAVVVPHGVLFRGSSEAKIREALIKNGALECVIGLAENLFYGTGISACVLVLRKDKKTLNRKEVLFINAGEIYTKGRAQNTMSEGQADKIYEIYKNQHLKAQDIEGVSRWVPLSEIKENDYNLNIARYVQKPLEEETITVEDAVADFKKQLVELESAEEELEALLAKEGFEL
jgi:type I restriction enzyme M protein